MTRLPLSVNPQAEEEAQKAARWYEDESQGLGVAFLELAEQTLTAISENPLRFPLVYRDVRRALLKRFPYGVFFRVRSNGIRVLAIMHLSRDTSRWQRRT
jgi:plasmid stabilization system protein ParE